MNKVNRIIYCIIDDVQSSHLFDFIERGLLPNLKKLMESGLYSKTCITDFPSVTYPTQPTMITGTYTGDYRKELCHGIPSSSWMGRYFAPPIQRCYGAQGSDKFIQVYKLNSDLGANCQTFLEMCGDGNKTSITQFINCGTDYMFPENKVKLVLYYLIVKHARNILRMLARSNTVVVQKLLDNFKRPKKYFENNEPPIASSIWFVTSDAMLHFFGYDSYIYKLNLLHIDKCLGVLIDGLNKMGYIEDTAIAIMSDHGNYKAKKNGDMTSFYERYGLKPYFPKRKYGGNINVAEFGGVGLFYFKGSSKTSNKYGWSIPSLKDLENFGPKKINLLDVMFTIEGCGLMYYREDGNRYDKGIIHLKQKEPKSGKFNYSRIKYKGTGKDYKTKYEYDGDMDVFGYLNDEIASKMVNNKYHSINEWMATTHHLDYPMYVDLIPRHMKNPRSSDIIISTQGNVLFNITHGKKKNDYIYTHDIGLRKSAIVPLIISGSPEIPQKEIPYCKTTDIVPSLIKLLGKKPHKSVIGDSLI